MATKYIFVTGGVVSGLGKGITAASLGRLLKLRGYKVMMMKFDPYINVDPGTMSPYQHGEVFVTNDGAETDLDLGHYERFIDEDLSKLSSITTGKIYGEVIRRERAGEYLGATVQVIPHITNEIKDCVKRAAKGSDILIIEIGGTVGDIESLPYLEATRQIIAEKGKRNVLSVHVTLMPYISTSMELKTKPTQHSVKELLSLGIQPDVIVCRSELPISESVKRKIALFCNVKPEAVIENSNVGSLYSVPLMLEANGLGRVVTKQLGLKNEPDLTEWETLVSRIEHAKDRVKIAVVGKYAELPDSYLSVCEALRHGGFENDAVADIELVSSETVSDDTVAEILGDASGILVPGGFGERGAAGKIAAIKYARENGVPCFGICFGMQLMVVEFARNVAGIAKASSGEFGRKGDLVIDIMEEQRGVKVKGGTMRLGSYPCKLAGGIAQRAYGDSFVNERHRHRYEFSNAYRDRLVKSGLLLSGLSPDGELVEIIEYPDHPFFLGVQFHPELRSRPNRAHPLFREFVAAAKKNREPRG